MYANNTTLNAGQFSRRRSWFVEKTEARLAEGAYDFAIISIDVCDFKVVNLIFGHDAGDRMLGCIYNAILACLGDDEVVVRDTADVFYALFHSNDKQEILDRLAKIRRNLDALVLVDKAYAPYFLDFPTRLHSKPSDLALFLEFLQKIVAFSSFFIYH